MASKSKHSYKLLAKLSSISAMSMAVAVLWTISVAWVMGATREVEIFFAASSFNALLLQLSSSGQISDIFTPIFHKLKVEHGDQAARDSVSVMVNVMLLTTVPVVLISLLFPSIFVNLIIPGFSEADKQLTATFFQIIAPAILLHVFGGIMSNFLRSEHHYGVVETLGFFSRLINLVLLLTLGWTFGIPVLIAGLWVSVVIRAVGTLYYAIRIGYRHKFIFGTPFFRPREVFVKVPFAFIHIFSSQFFAIASTASLSFLPEGSLATFNYARQLVSKIQTIILGPISIVFFNKLSESLANKAKEMRAFAAQTLGISLAATVLCIVPLACGGDLLLMALLGNKKFPLLQIQQTHHMTVAIGALIIFSAQANVARRTNLALKNVSGQFISSALLMIFCGALCYLLIPAFGLVGAVMVQYIAAIGSSLVFLYVLRSKDKSMVVVMDFRKLFQWAICAAVAVLATYGIRHYLNISLAVDRVELVVYGIGLAALSFCFCFGMSTIFNIEEANTLRTSTFRFCRKKLARE